MERISAEESIHHVYNHMIKIKFAVNVFETKLFVSYYK